MLLENVKLVDALIDLLHEGLQLLEVHLEFVDDFTASLFERKIEYIIAYFFDFVLKNLLGGDVVQWIVSLEVLCLEALGVNIRL